MKSNYAILKAYERINGSVYGNPNYRVVLELGDGSTEILRSSSNSAWCYGISRDWLDKCVTYTQTRSGRIDTMNKTTLEDVYADTVLFGHKEAQND